MKFGGVALTNFDGHTDRQKQCVHTIVGDIFLFRILFLALKFRCAMYCFLNALLSSASVAPRN